jgi:catalase
MLGSGSARADTPAPAGTSVSPSEIIHAFEEDYGDHPGKRKTHTKGICAAGEFVGYEAGAKLSRSALFSGRPVPVIARFSLSSGDPYKPDAEVALRGMALEFHLPGSALQHMTMSDAPIFAAATPDSFHDLVVALRPNPNTGVPDPGKLNAYLATHPDAAPLHEYSAHHTPTANFYQSAFFSVHTFKFIDAKGAGHFVRWRFIPRDGVKELTRGEVKSAPRDFLEANLIDRVAKHPVRWDMIVYVGEPGDPQDNPTLAWPESRKHFTAGTLTLSRATLQQKGVACEPINFDPLVMADGIAPSNDPILLFRSRAHAVSFAKRLQGQ